MVAIWEAFSRIWDATEQECQGIWYCVLSKYLGEEMIETTLKCAISWQKESSCEDHNIHRMTPAIDPGQLIF